MLLFATCSLMCASVFRRHSEPLMIAIVSVCLKPTDPPTQAIIYR